MVAPRTSTPQQHQSDPIPERLRQSDQWIVWRPGATDPATGKFPKIPFDPKTRKPNSDKDASTWMSYSAARRASGNVGYCLSETDGLTMVDLDHCVVKGVIDARALKLMQQIGGYWEFSPSGSGVKGWVIGKLAENITGVIDGISVEIYSRKRFGAVTGRRVPGFAADPTPAQSALDQLATQLTPEPVNDTPRALAPVQPVISTSAAELDAHAQRLLARLRDYTTPQAERPRLSNELRSTNRAFIQAVAKDYNAATSIDSELTRRGCEHTSGKGEKRYYSGLPGDTHSHTNSLKVEGNTVWSLSPNSRLYKVGRHGMKPFDLVVALDYNGKAADAARALFGTPATPQPTPQPEVIKERTKADAQRKRDARKAEAQAICDNVIDRASEDKELSSGAIDTLLDLLAIADGRDWCRPSNAQLAERRSVSERTIQRRLIELETRDYFRTTRYANKEGELWSGGKGTAIRTFLRVTRENALSPDLSNHDSDHGNVLVADKGGATFSPTPQPEPQAVAIEGGASFDPDAAIVPSGPYTGRSKHAIDHETRWEALRSLWASAPAPIVVETEATEQITLLEAPKPVEPVTEDRYSLKLLTMSDSELAGEALKWKRTEAKRGRKQWITEKRRAVAAEQRRRETQPQPVAAPPEPQTDAPPLQATLFGISPDQSQRAQAERATVDPLFVRQDGLRLFAVVRRDTNEILGTFPTAKSANKLLKEGLEAMAWVNSA